MAVLVTGCAGFIGRRLCETLLQRNETVLGLDALTDYYEPRLKRENLKTILNHDHFHFVECDLASDNLLPYLDQVDSVFHTAGQPGVRGSWGTRFHEYLRNNVLATQKLLESIKNKEKKIKVIYSSSSSIYGNPDQIPTQESALPHPFSPYGTTKLAAEHLCMLYQANYGIPVISLRYFTVYGPYQRPDMAFHIFMKAILNKTPITVFGDGKQTRDFTYVDDIVHANILAAEKPVEGEILNIGGGSRVSLQTIFEYIEEISGITPIIEYNPPTRGDVRDTSADTQKAKRLLGYEPKTALKDGLALQFQWAKERYSGSV